MNRSTADNSLQVFNEYTRYTKSTKTGNHLGSIASSFIISTGYVYYYINGEKINNYFEKKTKHRKL